MNYAEADKKLIIDYLVSKSGRVEVAEFFQLDGIEKLRIYPLIYRLVEQGVLEIAEYDELGAPQKVRLK